MERPLFDVYKDEYGAIHLTHGPGKAPPNWRFVGKASLPLLDEDGIEMSIDDQKEMLGA